MIPINKAKPNALLGAALGSKGININKFCNEFNLIKKFKEGEIHPVEIKIFKDKTFKIKIKQKTTTDLIKEIIKKKTEKAEKIEIKKKEIVKIAKKKLKDLNTRNIKKATKIIIGCLKSMKIKME